MNLGFTDDTNPQIKNKQTIRKKTVQMLASLMNIYYSG